MEAIGEVLLDAGGLSRVRGLLYPVHPSSCCIDGSGRVLQQRSGQSDSDTASMVFRTLRAGGQSNVNLAHYSRAYGEYSPLDSLLTMCLLLSFSLNVAFFSPFGLRKKH